MKGSYKKVLWAINEKCPYGCKYCYLGFDENHNPIIKDEKKDIDKIIDFLANPLIKIVFLAGAEPMLNSNIVDIIKKLKSFNKQIVLCTNGLIKNKKRWKEILSTNLDAISFSLDSLKKDYNDNIRIKNSWDTVTENILFAKSIVKSYNLKTKIGIYTVVTKLNLPDLYNTYKFCSENLNIDYYVYQPITLPTIHPLSKSLMLKDSDIKALKSQITKINHSKLKTYKPNKKYIKLMISGIKRTKQKKCFIKNNFIFLMPDGLFSQCPCYAASRDIRNIINSKEIAFNQIMDCDCFSEECSNIYQLINFEEILNEK